jgi:hypothetical protein
VTQDVCYETSKDDRNRFGALICEFDPKLKNWAPCRFKVRRAPLVHTHKHTHEPRKDPFIQRQVIQRLFGGSARASRPACPS